MANVPREKIEKIINSYAVFENVEEQAGPKVVQGTLIEIVLDEILQES